MKSSTTLSVRMCLPAPFQQISLVRISCGATSLIASDKLSFPDCELQIGAKNIGIQ